MPRAAHAAAAPIIGTLREGHLHASLRALYLEPGDLTEVAVDGYIADILRGDTIIEVQTANFSAIARKMRDLVARRPVRLVHPVARDRWIVKLPRTPGEQPSRRKSPKHLDALDIFGELVSFPDLINHPNFELDIVLTEEESIWRYDHPRRWRRRGWAVVERRLLRVHETVSLRTAADCAALLPPGLPDEFETADLAAAIGRPRRLAQQMAYCLRGAGCIERVGSRGNAAVYARTRSPRARRRKRA